MEDTENEKQMRVAIDMCCEQTFRNFLILLGSSKLCCFYGKRMANLGESLSFVCILLFIPQLANVGIVA
jgi:hypothetical protein